MAEQGESIKRDKAKSRILGGRFVAKIESGEGGADIYEKDENAVVTIPQNQKALFDYKVVPGTTDSGIAEWKTSPSEIVRMYQSADASDRYFYFFPYGLRGVIGDSYLWIGGEETTPGTGQPEAWDIVHLNSEVITGLPSNASSLGTSIRRFAAGYFVDLYYSGSLSNSHQVERPELLPPPSTINEKGAVIIMSRRGPVLSNKNNSNKVLGVYEVKQKAICTFGVYGVQVKGKVKVGDRLVSCKGGKAKKARFWERNTIGLALESGQDRLINTFIKP